MEFSLMIGKCLGCLYCPQTALGNAYKSDKRTFSIGDFRIVLDKLPHDCQVHFSGMYENLLHPQFDEFLDYAVSKGFKPFLFTTLVGLNAKKLDAIKRATFSQIRLHCPNKTEFVYDNVKWLALLDLFLTAGKGFTAMSLYPLEPVLQAEMDARKITVELPTILSRGGNLGWVSAGRPIKGAVTCQAQRWHLNECLPNGDVVLCCHDWGLTMPIGNIIRQPYEELYAAAEKYRLDLNPPDSSPCYNCDWARSA